MSSFKQLLLLPHIKVHNANALSSSVTIGFPAVTAFLGAVHLMQRELNDAGLDVRFDGTGIVSHQTNLQTYKGRGDFVHSIVGTGNPLDKSGARSAFIEEARVHLDVSLIIEIEGLKLEDRDLLVGSVTQLLHGRIKLAGGDIQDFKKPQFYLIEQGDDQALKRLQRELMPGYVLIERRELLRYSMENGLDAIDGLIDHLAVHHHCEIHNEGSDDETVQWSSQRKQINDQSTGWIIPIATGFQGISELGQAKNQRDEQTPHRFAEAVVTLGEFKMPHRLSSVEAMLWRYHFDESKALYLCQQRAMKDHVVNSVISEESLDEEF